MWKIVLPGIAMIGVTYAFARYSFGLFLPAIITTLNLSESQAGYISSAAYGAYTIALLTASLLVHKFSARHVVLLSGGTAFIGMLGMAASPGFYTLLLSSFFAGLGSGWISPAFSQVVGQSLNENVRDKANTWINSGTSFGIFFTGPVALLFTGHWRWSYVLFALLAFLVLWWNASAIKEGKQSLHPPCKKVPVADFFAKAKFLVFASIGVGFSSSIYWTFSRSYITQIHGLSANESIIFWMAMGGAGILGGIAGTLIQSIGLSKAYRLGVMATAASIFGLTISFQPAIYLSAVFFGISFIFMTGLFIVWGTRQFSESPSLGVSISFFSLGIGQSFGSLIAGILIERGSYPFAFIFFSIMGLLFLLCKISIVSASAHQE
ncbi:MFS transporter [Planococcus sp. CPCC 101016]|uniref:MFS transporter n=1 Tax=Planococcus sp. CPCC 101016 TaxID=2599617 RepID=UPI0011B4D35B|nr:MFS transporter [Planococcus sp. CPCC 101016]TWT08000.1 MFS transporter [Planococcus sp. CPCC 101016]